LGDLIDQALVLAVPGVGLPFDVRNQLNVFAKTQPALQLPGEPAAKSTILLGDLLDQALS
jgi:hypothetical protein